MNALISNFYNLIPLIEFFEHNHGTITIVVRLVQFLKNKTKTREARRTHFFQSSNQVIPSWGIRILDPK